MDAQVIVAGAGPVGLLLAAELRLHGVGVVVLERLEEPLPFSRAFGLHARAADTMELRGLDERMAEAGRENRAWLPKGAPGGGIPLAHFAGIRTIRLDRLDSRHAGLLPVPQTGVEAVLAARAAESGADVRRGWEVLAIDADDTGVRVVADTPAGRQELRAEYLVGCDGGRSAIRKLGGFSFPGTDPTLTGRLAEVAVPELLADPGIGWHRLSGGMLQLVPGRVLTVETDGAPARPEPLTVAEMEASISRVVGRPIELPEEPKWLTRFTDNTRVAGEYRRGRVLLAGDAAHVHAPFGGQGLNLGLQDAVNLGWKLAAVVAGWAPPGLLDSYPAERRPAAERVAQNTRAQSVLVNPDPKVTPLRELVTELMGLDEVNRHFGDMISDLEVTYDFGGSHPLTGTFLPAGVLDDRTAFHSGQPVLLDPSGDLDITGWADRVAVVREGSEPMLVRPDGYVAWAGDDPSGLEKALRTWFGEPR